MLSMRRTDSGVPCSIVTFNGCGGAGGGVAEEDAADGGGSAGGWSCGTGAGVVWEYSAFGLPPVAVESLPMSASSEARERLDFLTLGMLLDGIDLASFAAATWGAATEGFEALPTCRLLTTSFTPSTDAACRAAAARCASLSTNPVSVTTPLLACTESCLVESPES